MNLRHIFPALMCAALLVVGLTSCEDDPFYNPVDNSSDTIPTDTTSIHALLLNEGGWGNNNASLTLIEGNRLTNGWFAKQNGRDLGDIGQDIIVYGSRAYVSVTFSNSIEAVDIATGHSTRINMGRRNPRYLAAYNGNIYVTCYSPHAVFSIDTATLTITDSCLLGAYQPEGIALAAGKLFVVSSFIKLSNGDYNRDNKLYVVAPAAMEITDSVVVGLNPQNVINIDGRYLASNFNGDYGSNPFGCAIVDATTLEVRQLGFEMDYLAAYNGLLYGCKCNYNTGRSYYYIINPQTLECTELPISLNNTYGISVNPANGDLFVTTTGNYVAAGDLYCYSPDGTERWHRRAGELPKKVVFVD